ncbi:MAG TPA: Holliday junction branch migration protein RuvA [Ruania sp.]|nr:Holliday junction branch migration protein RuvA [Ruania sp.]
MIASVSGQVDQVGLDACVVVAGGIGYRVHTTPATLATVRTGAQATLATSMVVREDSMTLFGFAEAEERDVFELLQTVSGVGPRLALAMLAVHTPDDLRRAVAAEDIKALTMVPGIGQKGARRILLELGDRLGPASDATPPATAAAPAGGTRTDVVTALTGLGWPAKSAEQAVDAVLAEAGDGADTAELLRAALQQLGGNRHG